MLLSLADVALLAWAHAQGSNLLVLAAIGFFLMFIAFMPQEYFLPLMIFYLPWSSLLRIQPESSSFHSYALLLFLAMTLFPWLKHQGNFRTPYMALTVLFLAYTLLVKFFNGLSLNPQYIFFMAMMLSVLLYLERYGERWRFPVALLFLTLGNLSACLASVVYQNNQGILRFMDVNQEMIVGVRYSAFYSDPNYFSAQMLVAVAGWLIVMGKTREKKTLIFGLLMIGGLLYYALQAVSKAFLLSGAVVLALWLFFYVFGKKPLLSKVYVLAILGLGVGLLLRSQILEEQIQFYLMRFGKVNDAVSLTTGRLVLWKVYWEYMLEHLEKLAFGIGLSQDQLVILLDSNNAHMTAIQMLYQVGILGVVLLFAWWKRIFQAFWSKGSLAWSDWGNLLVFGAAILIPWFGLDVLYFREFFYFPLMLLALKAYLVEQPHEEKRVHDEGANWEPSPFAVQVDLQTQPSK